MRLRGRLHITESAEGGFKMLTGDYGGVSVDYVLLIFLIKSSFDGFQNISVSLKFLAFNMEI